MTKKTEPSSSEKRAKFEELATARVKRVIKGIRILANMGGKNRYAYEFTAADVERISDALAVELQRLQEKMIAPGRQMDIEFDFNEFIEKGRLMEADNDNRPTRFVTIGFFVQEMLGYAALSTYYNHIDDEGWPQRVYPGGKPMLVYEECVDYMRLLMDKRGRREPFVSKPEPVEPGSGRKRHTGRPAGLYKGKSASGG